MDLQQEVLSALFTEDLLFCGVMGKLKAMVVGNLPQIKVNYNTWALWPLFGYLRSSFSFLPSS